jgi:hypothetical protein
MGLIVVVMAQIICAVAKIQSLIMGNFTRAIARSIAALLGVMCVTACAPNFEVPASGVVTIRTYGNGSVTRESKLPADHPVRRQVQSWMAANHKWEYSFVNRAPAIVLSGESWALNVFKGGVQLKHCSGTFTCHLWISEDPGLYEQVIRLNHDEKNRS